VNPLLARSVARHALAWLVAANAVGVLLAALLLWPALNGPLAPFTYGRWMPLHLDWQLYGWCALPLIGALCAWMLAPGDAAGARTARIALGAWSLALALGGASWLGGVTSGKLFLDWSGWARPLLPLAMTLLWSVLAAQVWARRRELGRAALAARLAVLLGLLAVPSVLYWSAGRDVYPSVNPDSGGATGASLLGSTLGLVAIAGWLPQALGLAAAAGARAGGRWFWSGLGVSLAVFALSDHGHASHHARAQIAALGTLLAWAPLLWVYYRGFAWPVASRRWLAAALGWWVVLLASGWWTFLPGVSERFKFTHVLVAHAHLAMAGVVTSLGGALLAALGRAPGGGAAAFWTWQLACGAHLVALAALGFGETADAAGFFGGDAWVTPLLAARLAAGALMFAASVAWLRETRA
jgi:cytochrome c oxidase cbb3-type subunit I